MLELLINKQDNLKTIMLVENGILVEKHEEHEKQKRLEGNIYLGKVVNVLKGMQAAFIDIGEARHSLIKVQRKTTRKTNRRCTKRRRKNNNSNKKRWHS